MFFQNFRCEVKKHFVFKGPKLQIFHFHIFGSGISLESKILSFQCEIADKAEHIGPLQKVTSLLHISKYLTKFPIENIELGWLTSKKT